MGSASGELGKGWAERQGRKGAATRRPGDRPDSGRLGRDRNLADPALELHHIGNLIAANDDWEDDPVQAESITAAGLAPADPRESALQITFPTGAYTVVVQGCDGTTGVAWSKSTP
ncbi:MAG: hypothetical protein ABIU29_06170 [Chthoniobacterales bacterium]